MTLVQPPTERFDGVPTRLGFEPIPLTGGDFLTLMSFAFLPDSDRFLAVTRGGKVGLFRLERDQAVMEGWFQIPAVYIAGGCGASSIVIDPDFAENKLFYVGYCFEPQYNVIKRYQMSEEKFSDTLFTAANILAAGDPRADVAYNPIGSMTFAQDGALWVAMGDRRREVNARDLTNNLGKILRISPHKKQNVNGFAVPKGNPFSGGIESEAIYAYGLRNPWRGAFDSQGRYWLADVGASSYEEINVITKSGQDFGWPLSEGLVCNASDCTAFTPPVVSWDPSPAHAFVKADPLAKHDSRFRTAWVGIEYAPPRDDPYKGLLTGKMIYGDFYVGFVRAVALAGDRRIISDEYLGHIELPVAWRQGADGYVYVGTMYASFDHAKEAEGDANLLSQRQQGQLWRVVPLP